MSPEFVIGYKNHDEVVSEGSRQHRGRRLPAR